jgi:type II secretion system protein H
MKTEKAKKGFSLIELMVAIAILGVIASLTVAGFQSGKKTSNLKNAANKLASDIRLAQNYTLSSFLFGGDVPECGWGAHFSRTAGQNSVYSIIADIGPTSPCEHQYNPANEKLRDMSLPQNILVNNLTVIDDSGGATNPNSLDIIFDPPDPTAFMNDNKDYSAEIELIGSETGETALVRVNSFGMIEVE